MTDNSVDEVERIAIRISRQTLVELRKKVIASYTNKEDFKAEFLISALLPVLIKSSAVAHIAGQKQSYDYAKKGVVKERQRRIQTSLEFDLLDNVAKLLRKTIDVSMEKVKKAYNAVSLTALKNLAAPVEKKVRIVVNDLISEAAPLKRAIETIDKTLNTLGVGSVEENKIETLYRTQLQTSFNAGRWQADQDPDIQEILWGYKYVTAGDDRVREDHAALDGVTLLKDDPFWQEYWPPNGFNCRCQVIPIFDERETKQPDLLEDGSMPRPDEGFEYNPGQVLADATTKPEFRLSKNPVVYKV